MPYVAEFTVTVRAEVGGETDAERLEEAKDIQKRCIGRLQDDALDTWNWTEVAVKLDEDY